jgi:hypothetical protein
MSAALLVPNAALASHRPRRACGAAAARPALAPALRAQRAALRQPWRCPRPPPAGIILRIVSASSSNEDGGGEHREKDEKERNGGGGSKPPYLRNILKVQLSKEEAQRLSKARKTKKTKAAARPGQCRCGCSARLPRAPRAPTTPATLTRRTRAALSLLSRRAVDARAWPGQRCEGSRLFAEALR